MHIWVDADACPVVIKEILYRAAQRWQRSLTLVANQMLRTPPSSLIRAVQVPRGFDVADDYIVQHVSAGDLVITADIPLAAQVLAHPPLDPACEAPSYTRRPDAFPSARDLRQAWRVYRGGTGTAVRDGERLYSTPLEAGRLDGLAPALVAVGELDPVADDVTAYARSLRAAGNEVRLGIFPRTPHAAFLTAATGFGPQDSPLRTWLGTALRDHLERRKETR